MPAGSATRFSPSASNGVVFPATVNVKSLGGLFEPTTTFFTINVGSASQSRMPLRAVAIVPSRCQASESPVKPTSKTCPLPSTKYFGWLLSRSSGTSSFFGP